MTVKHFKHLLIILLVATLAGVVSACDSAIGPQNEDGNASAGEQPRMISVAGITIRPAAMEERMARIARWTALALQNPDVRTRVYNRLQASPFAENKVHFRKLLHNADVRLLGAMAKAADRQESVVFSATDSVVDLEFYMPVDRHRAQWNGGPQLLVASYPNDDGSQPRGFNLQGRPVALSLTKAPIEPTLVLTPVETNFAKATKQQESTNKDRIVPQMTHFADSAWYMTNAAIYNDHEGWGKGDPEFEVHTFLEQPSALYTDEICSGADMPSYYKWDMNGTFWAGDVMLVTQALVGETHLQFQMWEDDNGACDTGSAGKPPKTSGATAQDFANWASAMVNVYQKLRGGTEPLTFLEAAYNAIGSSYNLATATIEDDLVGIMEGPVNGCWPATGPAEFNIFETDGGTKKGDARIRVTYGDRTPVCPLEVQIDGPSTIYTCGSQPATPEPRYVAEVFSGSGPISYEWYEDGVLRGTGSTHWLQDLSVGRVGLLLKVDRGSDHDEDGIAIDIIQKDPEEEGEEGGDTCNA